MLSQYAIDKIKCTNLDIKMEFMVIVLEPVIKKIFDELMEVRKKGDEECKPLMTIEDVATRFKVTKATVHNWRKKGSIVGKKFGKNRYFTEDEVRKSMAKFGFTKIYDSE